MLLVKDPGHGGKDPGASGNGLIEADITKQITDGTVKILSNYKVDIKLTPTGATLSARAAFANQSKADFFFSIHVNAGGGTGYESYIHPAASEATEAIAKIIHAEIASFYKQNGFPDRGLKRKNLAVLRETKMPAMLIENLFIDNKKDAEFLKSNLEAIIKAVAGALVKGLGLVRRKDKPDPCMVCRKLQKAEERARYLQQIVNKAGSALAPEMHL